MGFIWWSCGYWLYLQSDKSWFITMWAKYRYLLIFWAKTSFYKRYLLMAWYMYLVYPMLLAHFEITRLMNMTAILQTSFEKNCIHWKCCILIQMPKEIDPNKSTLVNVLETIFTDDLVPGTMVSVLNTSVQVMACYRTGNKPSSEPMLTMLAEERIRYGAPKPQWVKHNKIWTPELVQLNVKSI